jgi:hypothetical protein
VYIIEKHLRVASFAIRCQPRVFDQSDKACQLRYIRIFRRSARTRIAHQSQCQFEDTLCRSFPFLSDTIPVRQFFSGYLQRVDPVAKFGSIQRKEIIVSTLVCNVKFAITRGCIYAGSRYINLSCCRCVLIAMMRQVFPTEREVASLAHLERTPHIVYLREFCDRVARPHRLQADLYRNY